MAVYDHIRVYYITIQEFANITDQFNEEIVEMVYNV